MARPVSNSDRLLTAIELQVMKILWKQGERSVHQVQERLNLSADKDYAYTTVSTMLRVLEKKGAVVSRKQGRGHLYSSQIDKEEYQQKATTDLVESVYSGEASQLICNLLGSEELTGDDIKAIKKLIKERSQS